MLVGVVYDIEDSYLIYNNCVINSKCKAASSILRVKADVFVYSLMLYYYI